MNFNIKIKILSLIFFLKTFFKVIIKIIWFLSLNLILLIFFSSIYIKKNHSSMTFYEILFNVISSANKTIENAIFYNIFTFIILPTILTSLIVLFINKSIGRNIINNKNLILTTKKTKNNKILNLFERNKDYILKFNILKKNYILILKRKVILLILVLINLIFISFCIIKSMNNLKIKEYLKSVSYTSLFFEKNYVNPKNVELTFPANKQNLIYIFVESFESTYFSKELGGNEEINLLKPITEITKNNINFSNGNNFGGAYPIYGTTYTTAGIVAQTLAVPLIANTLIINQKNSKTYSMKNFYGLGNILEKEGYKQIFLLGSDIKFGNRDNLMTSHGNYEIFDYESAKKENLIPKNFKEWWGYTDKKLFEIAKLKLKKIEKENKPFNFTILTTNTHFAGGFIEKNYKRKFKDKYSDAIYGFSILLKDFIEWCEKQKFYNNTTIVITGDHLSMDKDHFLNLNSNYNRTIYNLFINSKTNPEKIKNRIFTTFDMLPSTLSSMGVKIKGERLGLGTNLLSKEKTLAEKYGIDYMDQEIRKKSVYHRKLQNF